MNRSLLSARGARHRVLLLLASLVIASPAFAAAPPVITVSGSIDGSGVMTVEPNRVSWKNTQWGTPTALKVNGTAWNPSKQKSIDSAATLLPENLSDYFVSTKATGRDLANAEIVDGKLLIYFADTADGGANYDAQVTFKRKPVAIDTPAATMHVTAKIDGSNILRISKANSTWITRQWSGPANVVVNDKSWDTVAVPKLTNNGTTRYLPAGVDLSTVVFTKNSGRDIATYQLFSDHIDVYFADNPNGAGDYDVTLTFGSKKAAAKTEVQAKPAGVSTLP